MFGKTEGTEQRKPVRRPTPRKYRLTFGLSRHKRRFVMTFIAVLVIITFVIGFHALFVDFSSDESQGGKKIGVLCGEPLTDRQLDNAMIMARIHLQLIIGVNSDAPDFDSHVRKTAWRRLASLKYAAKLGITASEEEGLQSEYAQFTRDGVFNREAYDDFMTRRLRQLGVLAKDFHSFMQSSVVLSKLESAISSASWLAPFDRDRELGRLTDSFVVDVVELPRGSLANSVQATEAEARSVFGSNPGLFTQPDRMRVKYVVFPVSNYIALAATLPETRAREYYASNTGEFQTTSNQVAHLRPFDEVKDQIISNLVEEAATNYFDKNANEYVTTSTNATEVAKPFAEVKDQIVDLLTRQDARGIAEEHAIAFDEAMNPGRDGTLVPIEKVAAATNLVVYTSSYFGRYESLKEPDVSLEFNRHAFEDLKAGEPYDHFSSPIVESNAVYVLSFDDKIERHIPDFNVVSNKAYEFARKENLTKALAARATLVHKNLLASLKSGKSFAEAAAAESLAPISAGPFTWFTQPTNVTLSAPLVRSLSLCKERELTEPVSTTNGMAMAYVVSRVQGMSTADLSIVQYLAETMREEKAKRMFIDWQQNLVNGEKMIADDTRLTERSGTNELKDVAPPSDGVEAPPANRP